MFDGIISKSPFEETYSASTPEADNLNFSRIADLGIFSIMNKANPEKTKVV